MSDDAATGLYAAECAWTAAGRRQTGRCLCVRLYALGC